MPNPNPSKIVCRCGKGYACNNPAQPHFGVCRKCFTSGMSRKQRKAFDEQLYRQGCADHESWEQQQNGKK